MKKIIINTLMGIAAICFLSPTLAEQTKATDASVFYGTTWQGSVTLMNRNNDIEGPNNPDGPPLRLKVIFNKAPDCPTAPDPRAKNCNLLFSGRVEKVDTQLHVAKGDFGSDAKQLLVGTFFSKDNISFAMGDIACHGSLTDDGKWLSSCCAPYDARRSNNNPPMVRLDDTSMMPLFGGDDDNNHPMCVIFDLEKVAA